MKRQVTHYSNLKIFLLFICIWSTEYTEAQVCSGSLGDAVIKVDFGSGSGVGLALPSGVTSYNYVAQDCPVDGSYTIINRTNGCFSSTWYAYSEDHTPGDLNGYMMLVNSSLQPNDFYVDTVRGLCPNSTYGFSAWITNVILPSACGSSPTPPNVRFTIETVSSAILGTYNTGNIPAQAGPQWEKYGLFFTTNSTDPSVVLRMRNNAPGGCGNDLALDDISFRPCGPLVTTTVAGSANGNLILCEGMTSSISLAANVGSGFNNPSYQWQQSIDNGTTWNDIVGATSINYNTTVSSIGKYLYRLAVAEGTNIFNTACRVLSNNITVEVKSKPTLTSSVTSSVCTGALVNFMGSSGGSGSTFLWTGPNGFNSNIQNPSIIATSNANGSYNLEVTDEFGCKANSSSVLRVNQKPILKLTSSADTVCTGTMITINALGGDTYTWSPSNGLNTTIGTPVTATIFNTITYQAITTTTDGCKDTANISIVASPTPTVNAGVDRNVATGTILTLNGQTNDQRNLISWTPPTNLNTTTILQPIATALQDIDYTITATSPNGCGTASDKVSVKVFKGVFIPNSFTPNGDNINDYWRVPALAAFTNPRVLIYDRFGKLIYQLNNNLKGWDGKYKGQPAAAGAYTYLIDLQNGSPLIKGSLILIR